MLNLLRNSFTNYGNFSGRATRREFLGFALFFGILTVAAHYFDLRDGEITPVAGGMAVFELTIFLILLLPLITVSARRLHDSDRSGWWLLFLYLPYLAFVAAANEEELVIAASGALIVGALVLIILLAVPGNRGLNRYGADPREIASKIS